VINGTSLPVDGLVTAVALLSGYVVGSVPTARVIARSAGVHPLRAGVENPGSANIWKLAGPGWGFLALSLDLAKGVVPVAIGVVTWSWSLGWVAGLGALLGACWPAFGRHPGGRGVATLGGVAFALAPLAGAVSVLLTLTVLGAARLVGRNGRVAAIATGIGSFPPLFFAVQQDVARLCAVFVLYLVAVLRFVTTSER